VVKTWPQRLWCQRFWVDLRWVELDGRWLASADTPDGPSLGHGATLFAALWMALQPYAGIVGELLASLPADALAGSEPWGQS
jgi:hypothetical protein